MEIFPNPGQGWMRTNDKQGPFPSTVHYARFNWADLEPVQGKYNWDLIDSYVQQAKADKSCFSLRVITCSSHSKGYYTTPKWLFDLGCKGNEYVQGDGQASGGAQIPRIEPNYADPLYLKHQGALVAALAARYDGNPNLAFVDIGSYGNWGEWHSKNPVDPKTRQIIVDWYTNGFKQTPLVFMTDDAETLPYALAKGVGMRRDGVGSPWHEQNWIGSSMYAHVKNMAEAWKTAPVVFEWYFNYDYFIKNGWSFEAAVEFMLKNHVTCVSDNVGKFPPEAQPLMDRLLRQAGARLVLREASYPALASPGTPHPLQLKWSNVGVGKIYKKTELQIVLINKAGQRAAVIKGMSDPCSWLPGDFNVTEKIMIPRTLPAGMYSIEIGLVDPKGQMPNFRLAIETPANTGNYKIGDLRVL